MIKNNPISFTVKIFSFKLFPITHLSLILHLDNTRQKNASSRGLFLSSITLKDGLKMLSSVHLRWQLISSQMFILDELWLIWVLMGILFCIIPNHCLSICHKLHHLYVGFRMSGYFFENSHFRKKSDNHRYSTQFCVFCYCLLTTKYGSNIVSKIFWNLAKTNLT